MHPLTHLLVGWTLASTAPIDKRERAIVTAAAVLPDIDALGLVVEHATWSWERPLYWYSEYHHVAAHNLPFCLVLTGIAALIARRRLHVALLTFLSFHTHLLGDLVGSRGPDGYPWPIHYLGPFSRSCQLTWEGQWVLNACPNVALTAVLCALTLYGSWKKGRSPVELVSPRADAALVDTLRARFGVPAVEEEKLAAPNGPWS